MLRAARHTFAMVSALASSVFLFTRRHSMLSSLSRWCGVAISTALALPATVAGQSTTISGQVTAEGGTPLVGVTVSVVGLGIGSMTQPDGRYSFTVPASRVTGQVATLSARRVGYTPQSAQITLTPGTITHDFVMAATA